ncbi:MAG: hypothetical protein MJ252_09240 [archaeon]|nr:hypothetical protein [archaeon]
MKKKKKGLRLKKKKETKAVKVEKKEEEKEKGHTFSKNIAELIVNDLISKFVSLVVITSNINSIKDKMNDECYSYTTKTVNTFLRTQFICYDKDDGYKNEDDNIIKEEEEELSTFKNINTFSNSDSNSSEEFSNISKELEEENMKNFQNKLNNSIPLMDYHLMYDECKKGCNFWGDIPCPKNPSLERFAGSKIDFIINEKKKERGIIKENSNKLSNSAGSKVIRSEVLRNSSMHIKRQEATNDNEIEKLKEEEKKKKEEKKEESKGHKLVANSIKVLDDVVIKMKEEPLEIKQIRNQYFYQEKYKQEAKILNEELERKNKIKKDEEERIKKRLQNSNITVNDKGEIIFIKPYPLENLQKYYYNSQSNIALTPMNVKKNKKIPKVKEESNPEIIRYKEPEPKEENTEDSKNEAKQSEVIIPSGPNFDKIVPEVGVTITENAETKTGGKDFFLRFNKYSDEKFMQTLKNYFRINLINKRESFKKNNDEIPNSTNGNNTIENNTINSGFNTMNKFFSSPNNTLSKFKSTGYDRTFYKSNSSGNMLINNSNFLSIKSAIENSDLINERMELTLQNKNKFYKPSANLFKNKLQKNNLFRMTGYNSPKSFSSNLKEINYFTKQIVTGNLKNEKKIDKGFPRIFSKPSSNNKLQEIETSMRNTKYPRDRMKIAAMNILKMGNTSTKFFTKGNYKNNEEDKMMRSTSQKLFVHSNPLSP